MAAPSDEEGAVGPRYSPGVGSAGGRLRSWEGPRDLVVWVLGGVRVGRCVLRPGEPQGHMSPPLSCFYVS
ncbi:unnamed protein product [Coccothraustes coccothraustes]